MISFFPGVKRHKPYDQPNLYVRLHLLHVAVVLFPKTHIPRWAKMVPGSKSMRKAFHLLHSHNMAVLLVSFILITTEQPIR